MLVSANIYKGRSKTTVCIADSTSQIAHRRSHEKLTSLGIILQKYPNVLGTDVAGEVHEVGEGVTHVKKGDRVLGYAPHPNTIKCVH